MFVNCIAQARQVPDAVRDLDTLNHWLKKGVFPRFAVCYNGAKHFRMCNTPEEVAENAVVGCKIVTVNKFEKSPEELIKWVHVALLKKEFITV